MRSATCGAAWTCGSRPDRSAGTGLLALQILIVLALAAFLFPSVRRALKGTLGVAAAAFVLFLLVVLLASDRW